MRASKPLQNAQLVCLARTLPAPTAAAPATPLQRATALRYHSLARKGNDNKKITEVPPPPGTDMPHADATYVPPFLFARHLPSNTPNT